MQAPTYPPATKFEPPQPAPFEFGIDTVVVEELVSSPTIKRMLESEIPNFQRVLQSPQLKPHLSNFTLHSLAAFGMVSPEQLKVLDARLRELPVSERPDL